MSEDSRSDSNGSQKSRLGHTGSGRKVDVSELFRKNLRNLTDRTKNVGAALQSNLHSAFGSKKEASVYSKASRELNEYGYETFNIDDEYEIFISHTPESALFNGGEDVLERVTDKCSTTVRTRETTAAAVKVEEHTEPDRDVRSFFSNVKTGSGGESIITGTNGTVVDGRIEKVASASAAVSGLGAASDVPVDNTETVKVEFQADSDVVIMDPVGDAEAEAPSEDAWMYQRDKEAEEILRQHEAEAPAEVPAEEVSAPAPVEEPVKAEVPAEIPVEVPSEEPVKAEAPAPVEAPAAVPAEVPVKAEAAEEPVRKSEGIREVIEAKASVPAPAVSKEDIEGLYTENEAPISSAETGTEIAKPADADIAVTSSDAAEAPVHSAVIKGTDENGSSILPPITDDVRPRARPIRFRFHNGVLQNVPAKKEESEEGLRGPFDTTAGKTVTRKSVSVPRITIEDDVADIMRLTVPSLDIDEDAYSVEGTEDTIPDDGLEALCFLPEPVYEPSCIGLGGCVAIAPAARVHAIGAPAKIHAIGAPAKVHPLPAAAVPMTLPSPAEVPAEETGAEDVPEEEAIIPAVQTPAPASHGVTFGFGRGEAGGSVCFSF